VPVRTYYPGSGAVIQVYENQRGEALAANFIDGLSDDQRLKFVRLLREFGERGEIRNTQKFRLEQKPIYVFKSNQNRILCFYLPDSLTKTIILTHGFVKKGGKLPTRELARALQIYDEVVGRHNTKR
jgi:phage-related protein